MSVRETVALLVTSSDMSNYLRQTDSDPSELLRGSSRASCPSGLRLMRVGLTCPAFRWMEIRPAASRTRPGQGRSGGTVRTSARVQHQQDRLRNSTTRAKQCVFTTIAQHLNAQSLTRCLFSLEQVSPVLNGPHFLPARPCPRRSNKKTFLDISSQMSSSVS